MVSRPATAFQRRSATGSANLSSATPPACGGKCPPREQDARRLNLATVDDPKSLAILDLLATPSSTSRSGTSRPTSARRRSNATSSTVRARAVISASAPPAASEREIALRARDPGGGPGAHDLHHRLARGHRARRLRSGDASPPQRGGARVDEPRRGRARFPVGRRQRGSRPPKPKSSAFSTGCGRSGSGRRSRSISRAPRSAYRWSA